MSKKRLKPGPKPKGKDKKKQIQIYAPGSEIDLKGGMPHVRKELLRAYEKLPIIKKVNK